MEFASSPCVCVSSLRVLRLLPHSKKICKLGSLLSSGGCGPKIAETDTNDSSKPDEEFVQNKAKASSLDDEMKARTRKPNCDAHSKGLESNRLVIWSGDGHGFMELLIALNSDEVCCLRRAGGWLKTQPPDPDSQQVDW